jgi:hypothetical protein
MKVLSLPLNLRVRARVVDFGQEVTLRNGQRVRGGGIGL